MNPENRELLRRMHGDGPLCYTELRPVPKTVDDVLEASKMILLKYWRSNRIRIPANQMEVIDALISDPINIDHMQSFYLDIFSIERILSLFTTLVIVDFDYNPGFRKHAASFLYAAFIEILRSSPGHGPLIEMPELEEKLKEMLKLAVDPKKLDEIHGRSEQVAETDMGMKLLQ